MATTLNPETVSGITIGYSIGSQADWLRRITVRIRGPKASRGSGVIWRDGLVVTNAHVTTGEIHEVEFFDGKKARGRLLSRDSGVDLAAISVDMSCPATAVVRSARDLRAGEMVIAAGNPWDGDGAISAGILHHAAGKSPMIFADIRLAPRELRWPARRCAGQRDRNKLRRLSWARLRDYQRCGVGIPCKVGSIGGSLIRVLVWAKSAIARAGLEAIVKADERFVIARTDRDSRDLLTLVRNGAPDVVLLDGSDTGTPRVSSESLQEIDGPAFVVLVENPTRGELLRLLQDGQKSILLRDSPPDEITAGLYAASQRLVVLSPEILEILWPAGSESVGFDELPPGEPLTPRESEVLALLADGAANKEIASRLGISEHTAKFHVSSILNKLGATTRTEAVARGYKEGLIVI